MHCLSNWLYTNYKLYFTTICATYKTFLQLWTFLSPMGATGPRFLHSWKRVQLYLWVNLIYFLWIIPLWYLIFFIKTNIIIKVIGWRKLNTLSEKTVKMLQIFQVKNIFGPKDYKNIYNVKSPLYCIFIPHLGFMHLT